MNYRHAFHAGNFADVMKHATLALIIDYLKKKPKPFVVIDTHAGIGKYDLGASEALRTGEWRDGIARLIGADVPKLPDDVAGVLKPYLDVVLEMNGGVFNGCAEPAAGADIGDGAGALTYPGAGELARILLRSDDRLVLNELHGEDSSILRKNMGRDARVRTMNVDGWQAVKSLLPPKERRGVILLDPPFEERDEFQHLTEALTNGAARFAMGIFVIWYPIKAGGAARDFVQSVRELGLKRLLSAELVVRDREFAAGLNGSGLLIHNPSYGLDEALGKILPEMARRFAKSSDAHSEVKWLAGE